MFLQYLNIQNHIFWLKFRHLQASSTQGTEISSSNNISNSCSNMELIP